jgi:ketosteroid isomerase-like protein
MTKLKEDSLSPPAGICKVKDFMILSAPAKVQVRSVMRWMSALLFFVCACVAADLPANLKRDINAGNQAWVDGLKAGDANRIVSSYSQNSVNCNAAGDCVKGPMAVAAQYKEIIARFGRATSCFVRSETLHVDHDLAYESGYAEAYFLNGAVRRGRFSTVWKLQGDGHWKIFRNVSLPPAPDGWDTQPLKPAGLGDSNSRLCE